MIEDYTVVCENWGDWWVGYVDEIPDVTTYGNSLAEVRERLIKLMGQIIDAEKYRAH